MPHDTPAPPGPHEPGSTWIDLRKDRRATWIAYWFALCLVLGVPLAITGYLGRGVLTGDDGGNTGAAASAFAILAVPALVLAALLIIIAPGFLARQGVELSRRGIGVERRPKWWRGGTSAFVPWSDVLELTWGTSTGSNPKRILEVHLRRADDTMRLPRWAELVPAGTAKWGSTADRPRLVLDSDRDTLTGLRQEITAIRPDLSGDLANQGTPAAQPPPAPDKETDQGSWVDMRWQGAKGWFVAVGLFGYLTVGMTVVTIVVGATSGEIGATLGMAAVALVLGLITWPVARMGPRYSTVQGIRADGAGITLMQEPKRWFPGGRAYIPWSQVRHIGQDVRVTTAGDSRVAHYFVDIVPDDVSAVAAELPTWARVEDGKIRIMPNKTKRAEVVRALRSSRPDLFPGG